MEYLIWESYLQQGLNLADPFLQTCLWNWIIAGVAFREIFALAALFLLTCWYSIDASNWVMGARSNSWYNINAKTIYFRLYCTHTDIFHWSFLFILIHLSKLKDELKHLVSQIVWINLSTIEIYGSFANIFIKNVDYNYKRMHIWGQACHL